MASSVYPPPTDADGERPWIEIPFTVEPSLGGYRLDRYLKARIARMSRTRIQTIIGRGQVHREGCPDPLRASTRVKAGERLVLRRPAPREPEVVMDYGVIHRDDALLVLDKPAGLPVHPSARYHKHTLTALMRTRLGEGHGWEMAHRLDRETSGLMLFGRKRERPGRGAIASGGVLKRLFQQRRIAKRYHAIVWGRLEQAQRIDIPLGPAKDSLIKIKMGPRSVAEGGLEAVTEVQPLAVGSFQGEAVTVVACDPQTGRQHQIRVHLTAIGHPLVGDKLYGLDEQRFLDVVEGGRPVAELELELGLWRHALHAAAIALPHPVTDAPLRFESPWPRELAEIIAAPARPAPSPW